MDLMAISSAISRKMSRMIFIALVETRSAPAFLAIRSSGLNGKALTNQTPYLFNRYLDDLFLFGIKTNRKLPLTKMGWLFSCFCVTAIIGESWFTAAFSGPELMPGPESPLRATFRLATLSALFSYPHFLHLKTVWLLFFLFTWPHLGHVWLVFRVHFNDIYSFCLGFVFCVPNYPSPREGSLPVNLLKR